MIRDLFQKGQQMMLDEAAAEESTKSGKLRGGNTSMINSKGQIIGQCANLTYLRQQYHQIEWPLYVFRLEQYQVGLLLACHL